MAHMENSIDCVIYRTNNLSSVLAIIIKLSNAHSRISISNIVGVRSAMERIKNTTFKSIIVVELLSFSRKKRNNSLVILIKQTDGNEEAMLLCYNDTHLKVTDGKLITNLLLIADTHWPKSSASAKFQ